LWARGRVKKIAKESEWEINRLEQEGKEGWLKKKRAREHVRFHELQSGEKKGKRQREQRDVDSHGF
jgi:hypothetical protein